jgi:hypothetical protein
MERMILQFKVQRGDACDLRDISQIVALTGFVLSAAVILAIIAK